MTDNDNNSSETDTGPKKRVTKAKIDPIKVGDKRGGKKKGLLDTCE